MYGLIYGPKKWGDHRDRILETIEILLNNNGKDRKAQCVPGENCANIWKILEEGKIVGYFMIYVDDVLIVSSREWVKAAIEAFNKQWECKVSGIISNPGLGTPKDEDVVESLHFLGLVLEYQEERMVVHQTQYIVAKLQKRGLLRGMSKASLPQTPEGKLAPEYKNTKEYDLALDKCRIEVGALQLLAQKSRQDIAASTSIAASVQSKNPTDGVEDHRWNLEVSCSNVEHGNEGGTSVGVSRVGKIRTRRCTAHCTNDSISCGHLHRHELCSRRRQVEIRNSDCSKWIRSPLDIEEADDVDYEFM